MMIIWNKRVDNILWCHTQLFTFLEVNINKVAMLCIQFRQSKMITNYAEWERI